MIIVKAKIKEYAKVNDKPLNVSGDVAEKLNGRVITLIKQAALRAKENGRNTLMAKDF
jgi:histone H3/H4|tara:strand:- start:1131 stop:1304 length:174 start_codon:yes stop_codon:yes gene_type:complete